MTQHVIHSQLVCAQYDKDYPLIERGKGVFLYDKSGRAYLDASGCTAAASNIGHGVTEVVDALSAQAQKLAIHPTHVFHNEMLEGYMKRLCDFAPEGFVRGWTISGGTEAVENSIKLAFQYHKAKGRTTRHRVIGRWGSYHGNSLTALDVGGMKMRRDFYTEMMVDHLHVSPCFPYRKDPEQSLEDYETQLIDELRATIEAHPDQIVCFVAEPIVGAALGAASPTPNYFKRVHELCHEHDILVVADEVMTGFGRTGRAFGMEHFGNHADILACAKGISSGYFPMGAVIAHERVLEPIQASGHPFYSGQTYACIPLAAAVGDAVLTYMQEHKLVENSARIGHYLKEKLQTLLDIDCVGDVRGEGLFLGVEFVKDQQSKTPIAPELFFAKTVQSIALSKGLITYACRGTVNDQHGDHMLFSPPLTLNEEEADQLFEIFRESVLEARTQLLT